MAGDYTRFTFRPEHNRSGVLLQQGRVQLDADFNEFVELLDRRLRVETVDVIGRCGVPRETPNGFLIQAAGGALSIGIGRCYVDGLLAENRGTGTRRFEEVWGEPVGSDPTPYDGQPYFRPAPNPPASAGPHLVYLDVWQREVTAAEDQALVEPAVGIDTATRLQTVWAVRVLEDVGAGVTCASDWSGVAGWVAATQPSAARLTTAAVGVAQPADPCLVEPTGGYRGVENRLYRVEIHDDGRDPALPASFKWSRDDGAVAVPVLSIDQSVPASPRVRVQRIGRDSVLRFRDGDWIELLDDEREFAGRPGVTARIAPNGVDAQANQLTLDAPLADTIDLTRNPRARRWDQRAGVNARGVIEIGATPAQFDLEDGVRVTFDLDGQGGFRVGDYWAFAARTADASVEILSAAPPRGIRHHYCRLAMLESGQVSDCRELYPPEVPEAHEGCDCDVCVTPESHANGTLTIQAAIDRVARPGGKVCLAAGAYRLDQPLRISRARSLTLVGKGRRTMLESAAGVAIDVNLSLEVTIEHLSIALGGGDARSPTVGIALRSTVGTTVQRCFVSQPSGYARGGAIAIGLAGIVAETSIRENVLLSDIGVGALRGARSAMFQHGLNLFRASEAERAEAESDIQAEEVVVVDDLQRYLLTHGLWIEDNLLLCRRAGVDLGRAGRAASTGAPRAQLPTVLLVHFGDTRVAGNSIYGCAEVGIVVSGLVPGESAAVRRLLVAAGLEQAAVRPLGALSPQGLLSLAAAGGSRVDITGNLLSVVGYGIAVGCDQTRIADNDTVGLRGGGRGDGILLVRGATSSVSHLQVLANRVRDLAGNGITVAAPVADGLVKLNLTDRTGGHGIAVEPGGTASLVVEHNQVLHAGLIADEQVPPVGVLARGVRRLDLAGNVVAGVAEETVAGRLRAGIAVVACRESHIAGNEVRDVGPDQEFTGLAAGILVTGGYARCDVADNRVRLDDGAGASTSLALMISERYLGFLFQMAYLLAAPGRVVVASASGAAVLDVGQPGLLGVHGNLLESAGRAPTVWIDVRGRCAFSDNRCQLVSEEPITVAVVRVDAAIASANHFVGSPQANALEFVVSPTAANQPAATVLGNMGDGPIELNNQPLGAPWQSLNLTL